MRPADFEMPVEDERVGGVGYVVGTESESALFAGDGIDYGPAGTAHAVDLPAATHGDVPVLGYAVCGTPVRIWPELPFDPTAPGVDPRCAAVVSGQ